MIPYAILMMEIKLCLGEKIELRVLHPIQDGVSFRVINDKVPELLEKSEAVTFYFLDYSKKEYDLVIIEDFNLEIIEDEEAKNIGATLFHFHTVDKIFHNRLNKLIKDYTDYINLKLEYDELESMSIMTGMKISERYPKNIDEWKKEYIKNEVEYTSALRQVEIAICLDSPKIWDTYLQLELPEFLDYYWKENGLVNHPITRYKVTHIYIGNQFCPLLLPDIQTITACINKALIEALIPVVVFSTMPETMCEKYENIIKQIDKKIELVINDIGMLSMLKKYNKGFSITTGILMTKRKKDTRIKMPDDNYRTSIDDNSYQKYLREKLRVEKVSYEVTGYPIDISMRNSILHLPLYQMNTSGHCVLAALSKYGNRNKQEYVTKCPYYCENTTILYPENVSMIGKWNSLFGFTDKELNDVEVLNSYIEKGISRLVIRV